MSKPKIKLTIRYSNSITKPYFFEKFKDAMDFLHNEGDHVMYWDIETLEATDE